jgi:Branched-chain amino acid aminotransferase/4-amino-4-deoxychorismate lyase
MGVSNRTLLYGEGLFETIKLPSTEERLKLHYERLKSSAELFGIPYPSYEEFIKIVFCQWRAYLPKVLSPF